MRSLLVVASLTLFTGCAVVVPHGHSTSPAYASKHPHGGPPGQQKKAGKAKHHGHGSSCGHKRMKHDGVWVYQVEGVWYRESSGTWVAVRL